MALVVNPLLVWWKIRRNPFPLVLLCLRESGVYPSSPAALRRTFQVNMALCEKLNLDRDTYSCFYSAGSHHQYGGRSNHHYRVDAGCELIRWVFRWIAHSAAVERSGFCVPVAHPAWRGSSVADPLACNMFGISNDIAMQVVAVGFIIGVLQDSCETALNSSTDVLFTAAACRAETIVWQIAPCVTNT